MKTIPNSNSSLPKSPVPTAVTIGNFDGCHLGHQELIHACHRLAAKRGLRPVAYTFNPSPKKFFKKETHPPLFTNAQKERFMLEAGLQAVLIQNFDEDFALKSATEFFDAVLLQDLQCHALVIGENFRFGYKRQGDIAFLEKAAAGKGVELRVIAAKIFKGATISSSRIREVLLQTGGVEEAQAMLGHPYCLEGKVVAGQKNGRIIGFPTANLGGVEQLHPKVGVYAGLLWLEGITPGTPSLSRPPAGLLPAAVNIGFRPTFNGGGKVASIEAHAIGQNFAPDAFYGKRTCVYLLHRLRDERKFAGLEELKAQISRDTDAAKALLGGSY